MTSQSKTTFILLLLLSLLLAVMQVSCSDTMTGNDSDNDQDQPFTFDARQSPGASALDFLTDDDFDHLTVEIQYMSGYRPTDVALDNLQTFLEQRLNKSSVTIAEPKVIPALGQNSYSASQIRELEHEYRQVYPEENHLAAYFIVLDGEWDVSNVLGIAYYNTSMALFGKTIEDTSDGLFQYRRSDIETTVMNHEVGHIIGLVNNGVEMQTDHQDPDHGAHCDEQSCLMYYAVRTTDFFANVFDGNIPELDEACIMDLQMAGGK